MAKKKLYLQVSFEQGMIDTIVADYDYQEGDLKWQAPQSRSALYVENYDPTIVKGSLTKRYGYGFLRYFGEDLSGDVGLIDYQDNAPYDLKGLPSHFDMQDSVNWVDLDKFTKLIDNDPTPGAGLGSTNSDRYTVCGATSVPYNKPIGQTVLIYFIRDVSGDDPYNTGYLSPPYVEHTRVVHQGVHTTGSAFELMRPPWRNAHINTGNPYTGTIRDNLQPAIYPGWAIRGTFTGCARHGGNLVITTDVALDTYPWYSAYGSTFDWTQDWVKEMYPCYIWTYWDWRRKRDEKKFWNIISDGTTLVTILDDLTSNYNIDDKYSHFKVLYPSQRVTRQSDFLSWRAYGMGGMVAGSNPTVEAAGDFQYAVAYDNLSDHFLSTAPTNSVIEVSIIESRAREYSNTPVQLNYSFDPNTPITVKDELAVNNEYVWLNKYYSHISTIELPKTYAITSENNEYWKLNCERDTGPFVGYVEVVKGILSLGTYQRDTNVIAFPLESKTKDANGIYVEQRLGNTKTGDDFKDTKGQSLYWTVGVKLPNYLESNCPRPWLKGEKIPFVLTATIRGAEVLLGKYTHTVQMDDYEAYPSMWWPNPKLYDATFGQSWANFANVYSFTEWVLGPSATLSWDFLGPLPSKETASEQYYLAADQQIRFNGRNIVVASIRGYALALQNTSPPLTSPDVNGNGVVYALYKQYKPYCIEPFNPTMNSPYVSEPGQHTALTPESHQLAPYHRPVDMANNGVNGSGNPVARDNFSAGFRIEHINPKLIFCTIKINKSRIDEILEQGVESFNLYCAQPSDESAFYSVGLYSIQDPTAGVYMLPDIPGEYEYNKYRLVKRFVVDGDGTPYHDFATTADNEYWKKFYKGTPVPTNSWVEKDQFLIATGQQVTDKAASTKLTPDFILWDYPVSTTLSLNSSGKYWQGRGAKLVTNIKGRTFLSGCIDQYGEEEQAIVRYSDVQSGVITLDLFSEENYIRIGGLPHVALAEYREHLWAFSRSEVHRIQMPDIVSVSSWEYLDKIPGQGTFNQKTVITTPHGVVWANEGGVWLSDGRMPTNLAENVLTFYKAMATNNPPYYSTEITLPNFPCNEHGINPYMEVAYDEFRNELVVCSPCVEYGDFNDSGGIPAQLPKEEYRLVYSFANQIWHVQHADLPLYDNYLNEFDSEGKVTFE